MTDTCALSRYSRNNNNSDQQEQHSIIHTSLSTPLYELQHVFDEYKSHPELLKLILTSKVEEDKRRTEEAKLRSKELDYYLKHDSSPLPPSLSPPPTTTANHHHQQRKIPLPLRINVNNKRLPDPSAPYSTHRHHSINSVSPDRKNSTDHHQQQRRHSAATAMLAMGNSTHSTSLSSIITSPDQTNYSYSSDEEMDTTSTTTTNNNNRYPSPVILDQDEPGKPRKREMLAITKIVETRDFPYMDNYFWRNNGNTTQKKSGLRSIYYKCSNSNKGCQVNKTVTAKQNGEYLIKYRGNHMAECGMVERVRDL